MKKKYKLDKYEIGFIDAVVITFYDFKLLAIRAYRNIKYIIKLLLPVILLIPIWLLFLLFLQWMNIDSFDKSLYAGRFAIFTSIVLVAANNISNGMQKKHKMLLEQHNLYCEFMGNAEDVVKELNALSGCLEKMPNWVFYTADRARNIIAIFEEADISLPIEAMSLQIAIDSLDRNVQKIEKAYKTNEIIGKDDLGYHVEWCKKSVSAIKIATVNKRISHIEVTTLVRNMFFLIDDLRYPWRRDEHIHKRIRSVIKKRHPDSSTRCHYFNLMEDVNYGD